MRKDQIETTEISDAELDNVAGGVLNGAMGEVGGVMSTVGDLTGELGVGGVGIGNGAGNVDLGGVGLNGVSSMLGDL